MSWHGVCNQTYAQFAGFVKKININTSYYLCHRVLSLPLTGAPIRVRVDGELVSKPYVEITLNLMQRFGVEVLLLQVFSEKRLK